MDFGELNSARRSHRSYVPGMKVEQKILQDLLAQAALAPSAYNQQGWQVVVLQSPEQKEKLYREACPQQQVLDSSAMIIVCGNLEQYRNLPEIVGNTPSLDRETGEFIVRDAARSYGANPQLARDEALRSASLFAMAFMYAATAAGYGTGPMIGFDSEKLCRAFDITWPYFPALLISFGVVKSPPYPRGYRRPVSAFARFV